ncbi:MAG: histidine ammonia-lyase [Legionellales bacterium]|nr:histidine ammonia-lyase [Legionellales bacterium]|tara:strand:+ start:31145 stop:32626 length:1482 start_codon:yes stop_codon:yes gene_type:complete
MKLQAGQLNYDDLKLLLDDNETLELDSDCRQVVRDSEETLKKLLAKDNVIYGVNTGLGLLANTQIDDHKLQQLQYNLVLSHATGVGNLLPKQIIRLIMSLKINTLAQGYSGCRLEIIQALCRLLNIHMYPCIPSQGSLGASGDLAPLAHMSLPLIGEGEFLYKGRIIPAKEGLEIAGLTPFTLGPKEGLALLNGLQVSTAIGIYALLQTQQLFNQAIMTGAMSFEAKRGDASVFQAKLHKAGGQLGQQQVATLLREYISGSEIADANHSKHYVQDPYSLRCQPQVMGACWDQMNFVSDILLRAANGISDNPLVFTSHHEIVSGGNFHGEAVAMAADNLALAIAEIGALAERRIALLMDEHMSGLPAFLVADAGVNSGFMLAHVTAAALASENKSLAHPACVDSLPTSGNQEDHVSMATFAANRLLTMCDNTRTILAIELLAACQGIDFHEPLKPGKKLKHIHARFRELVPHYDKDRLFKTDIDAAVDFLRINV